MTYKYLLPVALILMVLLTPAHAQNDMGNMAAPVGAPVIPPVQGYSEGKIILFVHTESSDAKIARTLTTMMGSPVLVVPTLAQAPRTMLANVYAFTNGSHGSGPLGAQSDVFDRPPGTRGYSPLRAVTLVTWKSAQRSHILKSAGQVRMAAARGELTIRPSGTVVNMPMLAWPGGHR